MLLGVAVAILLVFLTVIGASAQHGTGAAHLRRGPASVVLSVLFTLAGLAGVGSLALLFWGLVTRNRRTLDGSEPRRHSPIFVAGAALMVFACLAALLALAARGRHLRSLPALSGRPLSHTAAATNTLPFNKLASFTTSGIVIGIVVLLVMMRLARSIGWRRALHRLRPLASDTVATGNLADPQQRGLDDLATRLASVSVADPSAEPDPRRAVVACYLQLLEVAACHGAERRTSETPAEYLRRRLAATPAGRAPATSLTGLFERARYSQLPIGESMRSEAIVALDVLRKGIRTGAVA